MSLPSWNFTPLRILIVYDLKSAAGFQPSDSSPTNWPSIRRSPNRSSSFDEEKVGEEPPPAGT